ncbi:MAG: flagellar basal body rod protein FlgB [Pseudomonas sp.]
MIDKLSEALHFQHQALRLRHQRQDVLANNIANADTPNFKARDIDFAAELARAAGREGGRKTLELNQTSARHLGASGGSADGGVPQRLYQMPEQSSLDGNTVEMERERVRFADNALRYQAGLTFMNRSLQGLKTAMQSE